MKSFRPKGDKGDGNGWSDFHGQKRSNETHESTTDSETRLTRKGNGQEVKLCFGAHSVMENRNGLCVLFDVRPAVRDCSESRVAVEQLRRLKRQGYRPESVGADKDYRSRHFVESLRRLKIKPHPALLCNRDPMGVILNAASQYVVASLNLLRMAKLQLVT